MKIRKKLAMVFSKNTKILQKLVYVLITENIWSNLRRVVQSAGTNEFNTIHNIALHLFFGTFGCVFRDAWLMSVFQEKEYWCIRVWGEFAKSRAIRACVPTCLRASVLGSMPTCQRASMPTCQKRANFSFLRVKCHSACHCFTLACQSAKWRANFSTWRAFQTFLLRSAKENFYTSLLHEKFYIWLDIIVKHMTCILVQ